MRPLQNRSRHAAQCALTGCMRQRGFMTNPSDDHSLPRKHRALFLSDLHLGSLGCRADLILEFLRQNTAPTIYLVGDVLDIWHPLHVHWSATHDAIMCRHGCWLAKAGSRAIRS